jgi:hypothetical protein
MGREEMRAGDADRQSVADQLKRALDEGRLDLHEYDERLQQAYGAKTYGELEPLLTDLPATAPPRPQPLTGPAAAHADHLTRRWLLHVWSSYLPVVAITTTIWLISCVASGEWNYFWPIWVAGPLGIFVLWETVSGLTSDEPRKWQAKLDKEARKKQLKQERKARELEKKKPE